MSNRDPQPKTAAATFFPANPVLRRLNKLTERAADSSCASYAGIAVKTCFFLLMTLAGMMAYLLLQTAVFSKDAVQTTINYRDTFTFTIGRTEGIVLIVVLLIGLVSELVGIFARRTIPVTGTVYSASQGFVISFLVFKVLKGYEHLGLEALLLTASVVAVMCWLYVTGKVRPTKRFNTILMTLVLGSISVGLLTFIASLIPATRPFVMAMQQNAGLCIALDLLGIVIASLFLISDFSVIESCVANRYPKDSEWFAAFGLVFTVIWLYLKILDLLMRLNSSNSKK